ncbi:malate dehydrogenase [bacterium]|nr:malate dehydrogenase [bacterium]|tara:strand:- start:17745 stop:18695 length:951 start_codon:yes stop_codon:yes gene_type:complete
MSKKVGFVGAGFVGAEAARQVMSEGIANVALVDIAGDMAKGKALDLTEAAPILKTAKNAIGGSDYKLLQGSDVIVVTAGIPRKPGMSRDDLLKTNILITKEVCNGIKKYAPGSIVIMVTNPLDAIVYVAQKFLEGTCKVIGMAGALDSARFRTFLSMETGVSSDDIQAMVLGSHGDAMVPLVSSASISGIPAKELINDKRLDEIVERTQKGGGEIVALLKTGSAYYAPGISVASMVKAIILDENKIIPTCTQLNGEYGESGIFMGVPAILGSNGVKKIIEVSLSEKEKNLWGNSLDHVKELMNVSDSIIKNEKIQF